MKEHYVVIRLDDQRYASRMTTSGWTDEAWLAAWFVNRAEAVAYAQEAAATALRWRGVDWDVRRLSEESMSMKFDT